MVEGVYSCPWWAIVQLIVLFLALGNDGGGLYRLERTIIMAVRPDWLLLFRKTIKFAHSWKPIKRKIQRELAPIIIITQYAARLKRVVARMFVLRPNLSQQSSKWVCKFGLAVLIILESADSCPQLVEYIDKLLLIARLALVKPQQPLFENQHQIPNEGVVTFFHLMGRKAIE